MGGLRQSTKDFSVRTEFKSNKEKREICLFWLCFTVSMCLVLAVSIYSTIAADSSMATEAINLNRATQISEDWRRKFYTTIKMREGECKSDEEAVFKKVWGGLEMGCILEEDWFEDAQVIDYNTWYEDYRCTESHNSRSSNHCSYDREYCIQTTVLAAVEMDSIKDHSFCGEVSSVSFMDAKRVDSVTEECPSGTLPCSLATSAENTICMEPTKSQKQQEYSESDDCPIVDMFLLQKWSDVEEFMNNTYDWTATKNVSNYEDDNELWLIYTKNATDSLPVSSTKVSTTPCIDPFARIGGVRSFYPTEIDRNTPLCAMDEHLFVVEDSRYTSLDFEISDLDLMEQNDVMDNFQAVQYFNQYVRINELDLVMNDLWFRPTIPFNLECEASEQTRSNMVSMSDQVVVTLQGGHGEKLFKMGLSMAIMTGIFLIFVTGCLACTKSDSAVFGFCCMIGALCQAFIVSILLVSYSAAHKNIVMDKLDVTMNFANEMKGCSDDLMELNEKDIEADLLNSLNQVDVIFWISLFSLILTVLTCITLGVSLHESMKD